MLAKPVGNAKRAALRPPFPGKMVFSSKEDDHLAVVVMLVMMVVVPPPPGLAVMIVVVLVVMVVMMIAMSRGRFDRGGERAGGDENSNEA